MAEYNHQVIGVFPTEESPGTPFAYTSGRETELLMTGLGDITVMGILLNALTVAEDEGAVLQGGAKIAEVLANGLHLTLIEVLDMREAEMFQSSGARALQAVWPDKNDLFPWDEGYELSLDVQPLYGEWRGVQDG